MIAGNAQSVAQIVALGRPPRYRKVAVTSVPSASTLEALLAIGQRAGDLVMQAFGSDIAVEFKGVDDPVTRADRDANALICTALAEAFPGIPIVAEESDPATYAGFSSAKAVFFVDPIDGTREFIAKNPEFAVMIGLAQEGAASLGVIVCPALERSFYGEVGAGAFEVDARGTHRSIHVSSISDMSDARIVVSRSRRSKRLDALLARFGSPHVIPCGSAGVKAVLVAAGEADLYVQAGMAGMRWDACGPEAIVRAAGGRFTEATGGAFDYTSPELTNSRGFVATNGILQDRALEAVRLLKEMAPKGRT